jgi:hypothetical protein
VTVGICISRNYGYTGSINWVSIMVCSLLALSYRMKHLKERRRFKSFPELLIKLIAPYWLRSVRRERTGLSEHGFCTSVANMQYLHRHNNVAKTIHQQIAIDKKLLTMYTLYYKYTATEVLENQIQALLGQRSKNFGKQTRYPTVW